MERLSASFQELTECGHLVVERIGPIQTRSDRFCRDSIGDSDATVIKPSPVRIGDRPSVALARAAHTPALEGAYGPPASPARAWECLSEW